LTSLRSLPTGRELLDISMSALSIASKTPRFKDDYVGDWSGGKRHGRGKMTFQNGDIY